MSATETITGAAAGPVGSAVGGAVGIELCSNLIRGVRLGPTGATIERAAEVALLAHDDDQSMLDAMIRLRADLDAQMLPARLATFPTGSWMRRLDVTGKTGPELNSLRTDIDRRHRAASTLLVDDGPRRWLHVIHWPDAGIRRIEALAERAGFVDVAVEPSPVALGRAVSRDVTVAARFANVDDASATVLFDGMPVAAISLDSTGQAHPNLELGRPTFSPELFEEISAGDAVAELIEGIRARIDTANVDASTSHLFLAGEAVPHFPPHDLRSTKRQCVAIGAAIGASGMVGPIRPVDIVTDAPAQTPLHRRPWVVERLPTVDTSASTGPGTTRRTMARLIPRRRR